MSSAQDPTPSFEALLTSLEKTIERLAGGTAPLDELVAAHERAVQLLAQAEGRLQELKVRAELLAAQLR